MSRALRASPPSRLAATTRSAALVVGGSTTAIWAASWVNWVVFGGTLAGLAITPRTVDGLIGILIAPFLHGSVAHLVANTVGLLMLAPLTLVRRRSDFWAVSALGALTSGLGAWLLGGPGTVHLGASGVLFAYLGFLMTRGLFERSVGAVLLSVLVTWAFGGMIWGVFPIIAGVGVSWQAHLFGFLGGIGGARLLRGRAARR